MMYMHHSFLVHSSADGHLGCFHVLTIINWMKHKLESRLLGENINNLIYADDTTLMAESEEELKSILMKVKEESEKVDLKLNI